MTINGAVEMLLMMQGSSLKTELNMKLTILKLMAVKAIKDWTNWTKLNLVEKRQKSSNLFFFYQKKKSINTDEFMLNYD